MVVDDPTQTEKMPILGAAARSTLCMTYSMLDDYLTYSMVSSVPYLDSWFWSCEIWGTCAKMDVDRRVG